jgi:hypothetical protein
MAEQILTGSCLCGALKYRVSGAPARFYHCHCSRCRKASGAAHTSNLFVEKGTLEWEGDTEKMKFYKLPEAERFSRTFCDTCGGPLPREIPNFGLIMIPAGTLNEEPNLRPQARIFQDSKTSWSCSAEELPLFADYPK